MFVMKLIIFSGATEVITSGGYGGGTGPVWLYGLGCSETSSSLQDCVLPKAWGEIPASCEHWMDVSVVCTQSTTESGGKDSCLLLIAVSRIVDCPAIRQPENILKNRLIRILTKKRISQFS
jgi:hypothetical protein